MTPMATLFRPRTLILFVGDLFFFAFALWLSLLVRYVELPSWRFFELHLEPFTYLFAAWVAVYFIAGLYEGRLTILARRALSSTLLIAQIVNMVLAAIFFFLLPFGIAPKTILLIYLLVSFPLILIWRAVLFPRLGLAKQERAIVVGAGPEVELLSDVLSHSPFAPVRVAAAVRPNGAPVASEVTQALKAYQARFIIADFNTSAVVNAFPHMYNLLREGVRFFDALELYEQVLGRVPLSVLDDRWFARNVSRYAHMLYDGVKRFMDIVVASVFGLVSLIVYPFIIAALKIQDGGEVIISMPRVGENGEVFNLYKFRSMTGNDKAAYGAHGASALTVTPVGAFLRVTRLDEIPQIWNVLKGDLSLIGPRPEAPTLVELYQKEIPYYGVRHLVKPGLSGWAQLYHDNHPHHSADIEATREKLSYDLYYLKHRSVTLDAIIILKTIKKLLTRSGV